MVQACDAEFGLKAGFPAVMLFASSSRAVSPLDGAVIENPELLHSSVAASKNREKLNSILSTRTPRKGPQTATSLES